MQLSDFFHVGGGLGESFKIVLFKMLPRAAQIEKVRAELNRGLLKKYGKLTKLEIDQTNKNISCSLDLKGEKDGVRITLSNYQLIQDEAKNPVFDPGTIEVSREWLNAVVKTLVKKKVIPGRIEIKNLLHQAVLAALP